MARNIARKKLVIIGDGCTGKTALIMTYVQKTFPVVRNHLLFHKLSQFDQILYIPNPHLDRPCVASQ
jgi:GTPase SAR1 family protein